MLRCDDILPSSSKHAKVMSIYHSGLYIPIIQDGFMCSVYPFDSIFVLCTHVHSILPCLHTLIGKLMHKFVIKFVIIHVCYCK